MGCKPSDMHMEIHKLGKEFNNNPAVKKLFSNPGNLIVKRHQQLFGFKPSDWKAWEPTKTDINKFKGELKYMMKWITLEITSSRI